MLQKLYIQNYAIIDEIEINFSSQLNIITGETGAGKSILMGALSLILGERADTSVLMNNQKKCFIEGYFSIDEKKTVANFLEQHELENEAELVIRREIAANGKSRAFINDTPATLQQLKQLASLLVDLHQQFDTLELGNEDFQREVVDALADNQELLKTYQANFKKLQHSKKELTDLQQQKNDFNKEADYNSFLLNELTELSLKENELEDLDNELKILNNSEGIKTALNKVFFELKESEQPIITTLKQLIHQINNYTEINVSIKNVVERLQSSQIELTDIAQEVENINDSIGYDEQRIQEINDKLSLGYKLLKKHGVKTTNELLEIEKQLQQKLQTVLNIDEAINQKQNEIIALEKEATTKANELTLKREKQKKPFEEKVNHLLHQVGMPNAKLKVQLNKTALQLYGINETEFLFDANNSNKFESIRKVASGGELSRLMLCIKSLVAQKINLPTLIFDEIDTGISGEAAKQVGIILRELTAKRQVICITHQPQIAGKAHAHFFVYKGIKDNAIKTNIRLLNDDERITAIAKMLSGEKPSAAALESAREMMN